MAGNDREWVPVLKGWHSFPEVALKLGVARQRIFQMLDEGKLLSARRVPGAGERPAAYVISTRELERLKAEQLAATEGAAARAEGEAAGELAAVS